VKLSTRQWAAIVVAAVVFVVGAIVLSGGSGGGGEAAPGSGYDPVAWCQSASALSTRGAVLDPGFGGDPLSELINLDRALLDGIAVAPGDTGADLARVEDFASDINTALVAGKDLPSAITEALNFADRARLDVALNALSQQITACGYAPLPTPG